jgi:hypothetical protein
MEKMLVYDAAVREDKAGYEQVVRAVLAGWNKRWTQGRFEYDPVKRTLLLRGDQLKKWAIISQETSGESPLRFLHIKALDARGTGLHDLNHIKSLSIQSLDIRGTKVADLAPILQFPTLETLTVSLNQFSVQQLTVLPKALQVLILD